MKISELPPISPVFKYSGHQMNSYISQVKHERGRVEQSNLIISLIRTFLFNRVPLITIMQNLANFVFKIISVQNLGYISVNCAQFLDLKTIKRRCLGHPVFSHSVSSQTISGNRQI